jgi:hypothetical protein
MIPKGKLLALLMIFTAVGGLAATGAFTTVQAERTADVNVDGDANALLAIQPNETSEDSNFIQDGDTSDSTFSINLEGEDGNTGSLNANATTTAENLFNITNNGEEDVDVWISTNGGAQTNNGSVNTTFYVDDRELSSGEVTEDAVNIDNRIDKFNAFVDTDDSEGEFDVVMSESEASDSIDESPGNTTTVNLDPGESIRVSLAIEIEDESDIDLSDSNQAVLEEVTIIAVNDDESDAGSGGTITNGINVNGDTTGT